MPATARQDEHATPRRVGQHGAADGRRQRSGAMPMTSMRRESIVAAAEPVNRSRTMAMATTETAALPRPWTTRATVSSSTVGADAAEQRRRDVQGQTGDEGLAAADGVGERADEQLSEPEAEEDPGEGALHLRLGGGQLVGDGRHRGQVRVDRERADGDEGAEDQDELGVGPALGGLDHDRASAGPTAAGLLRGRGCLVGRQLSRRRSHSVPNPVGRASYSLPLQRPGMPGAHPPCRMAPCALPRHTGVTVLSAR